MRGTLASLRQEPYYEHNGRNAITLVKNSEIRVVLQAMQPGSSLAEHHAPGPITVQVLEGEIRFHTGGLTQRLRAGELLVLPAGVPHSVDAVQESAFLLTIAPL